jgi:hypothetical protein
VRKEKVLSDAESVIYNNAGLIVEERKSEDEDIPFEENNSTKPFRDLSMSAKNSASNTLSS